MPLAERERRDVYFIPQNFIDTGSIFGGSIRLRNAVEALGGEIEQEREFYGDPDYEYLRNLE